MNDEIESLLNGSIDLHVHSGPDTKNMRMDAMETARSAYEAGMAGFVLKSNDYLTTPLTYTLSQIYPGLAMYGSISLNSAVGGCLLYTSPSPRDATLSRMPSSA